MKRDSINWAKERGLSEESYFPNCSSKPGSRHTIDAVNFAFGR